MVSPRTVHALLWLCAASCHSSDLPTATHPEQVSEPEPEYHENDAAPVTLDEGPLREAGALPGPDTVTRAPTPMEIPDKPHLCRDQRGELPPLKGQALVAGPPLTNRIPPEIIQRPVRAARQCFAQCLHRAEAHGSARIVVRFVVDLDGLVRNARVTDYGGASRPVADCIAREFGGLEFIAPNMFVTVMYPLTLEY